MLRQGCYFSYGGYCVRRMADGFEETHLDRTIVQFPTTTECLQSIDAYLSKDQPWDCAGSFRSEGLGAILFEVNRDSGS